jgi:acyl-CoA thioesterase-1
MSLTRVSRISILLFFTGLAGLSASAFSQTPQTPMSQSPQALPARLPSQFIRNLEAGKPQTLVAFGTSLTAGGAWVGLVDAWLKAEYPGLATVFNEGASGHSSKYGLTVIQNVTRHAPDAVLIEFAMNDAYYPEESGYKEGVPVDTSRENLRRIIEGIKAARPGCEFIPQTMDLPLGIHLRRRPEITRYYAGYRTFAAAQKLILADHEPNWKAILDFDTSFYLSWLPDSIHPNAEASAAITFPGVLSALTGARIGLSGASPDGVYAAGSDIPLTAQTNTPLSRVEFYSGKKRIGTDSAAPFLFTWKGVAAGKYLVMARLLENGRPVAVSVGMPITVKAASGLRAGVRKLHAETRVGPPSVPRTAGPSFWLGRRLQASSP